MPLSVLVPRRGKGAWTSVPRRRAGMLTIMELDSLAREIDSACRLRGQFTLRSGQVASEYFDKYLFESQPALLHRVAEAMLPYLPSGTDLLGGLELGGVPIATMVSALSGIPAVFVRQAGQAVRHPAAR